MVDDDDDFGEGEVEDTQHTNMPAHLALSQIHSPAHNKSRSSMGIKQSRQSDRKSNKSRTRQKSMQQHERSASKQSARLPPFVSPYPKAQLESFPQRTRWAIPDSKIVFSSEFCSGNLARA